MNKPIPTRLTEALTAAGVAVAGVSGPYATPGLETANATWHTRGGAWFRVDWPAPPQAGEQTDADAIVQTRDLRPRVPRRLADLTAALNALSNAQKAAIWNDLTSGTPSRGELNAGASTPVLALLQTLVTLGSLSAADVARLRLCGVALYCQDNPGYLVQPSFDPTIQVAGDEAAG